MVDNEDQKTEDWRQNKRYAGLKPFGKPGEDWRTPEQVREWAQMGSKASSEARRRNKKMMRAMKWLLESDHICDNEEVIEKLKKLHIEDATNAEALVVTAMAKAYKGDVEAMKFVRDTGGEAPKNQVELSGDTDRPVATLDLRNLSEEELLRLAEAKADEEPVDD